MTVYIVEFGKNHIWRSIEWIFRQCEKRGRRREDISIPDSTATKCLRSWTLIANTVRMLCRANYTPGLLYMEISMLFQNYPMITTDSMPCPRFYQLPDRWQALPFQSLKYATD